MTHERHVIKYFHWNKHATVNPIKNVNGYRLVSIRILHGFSVALRKRIQPLLPHTSIS